MRPRRCGYWQNPIRFAAAVRRPLVYLPVAVQRSVINCWLWSHISHSLQLITVHDRAMTDSPPPIVAAAAAASPSDVERLLRELPEWFGIESAVEDYVRSAARLQTFLAWPRVPDASTTPPQRPIGALLVEQHPGAAAEIHLMAVERAWHRRGVGRALLRVAEARLFDFGVRLLEVKTLGPSQPDAGYAATRRFYQSMGFLPVEELLDLWGEGNPCLIMVKPLG